VHVARDQVGDTVLESLLPRVAERHVVGVGANPKLALRRPRFGAAAAYGDARCKYRNTGRECALRSHGSVNT
jgi:hypothetical protein